MTGNMFCSLGKLLGYGTNYIENSSYCKTAFLNYAVNSE